RRGRGGLARRPADGPRLDSVGLSREDDAEALDEPGDAAGVHLERVALAEGAEIGGIGDRRAAQLDELGEEALEARRRDDLEDPARLVARVPEGVPLAAGLEDEVAGPGLEDLVAEEGAHAAFDHVAVLVLAVVPVQRGGEGARGHGVL